MASISPNPHAQSVLKNHLGPLIKEYGYDEVRHALVALGKPSGPRRKVKSAPTRAYLTASSLVEREPVPEYLREKLVSLAERFDAKTFLPRVADVRRFIETRGAAANVHQRTGAFKHVLPLLLRMSEEEWNIVERDAEHAGPARLGPLSDAIRSTGAAAILEKQSHKSG